METPPPEPVRRSARNALIEIPNRMGALHLTNLEATPGNLEFTKKISSICLLVFVVLFTYWLIDESASR